MKTILKTGPGFFAAKNVQGKLRISCCSIEIYELDQRKDCDLDVVWNVLPAMTEDTKGLAAALLQLLCVLQSNEPLLIKQRENDSKP